MFPHLSEEEQEEIKAWRCLSQLPPLYSHPFANYSLGKMVMHAASDNLTPLTLELGGKNPCLIAPDYDLEHAAHEICDFKAANAGQMCTCVDYVLVPKGRANEFAEACMK